MAIPISIHQTFILFLFLTKFLPSCSPTKISYEDHCGSVVPLSPLSSPSDDDTRYVYVYVSDGHFSGGDQILAPEPDHDLYHTPSNLSFPGSFYFYPRAFFNTKTLGVLQLDGQLSFQGRAMQYVFTNFSEGRRYHATYHSRKSQNFDLSGFWSKSTGKLCMVGPGNDVSGKGTKLSAVFKLIYPLNSNISASFVRGTVESLDASDSPSHFDTISVLGYSRNNYSYTQVSQIRHTCSHVQVPTELLSFDASLTCHFLTGQFILEYGKNSYREKNLGPFSKFLTLNQIECTADGKVNMLIGFSNSSNRYESYDALIPGKSLVGEGFWDGEKKHLCLVACKILETKGSLLDSSVGECTIGLSLWIPAFYTLKRRNTISGRIWSTKDKTDPGYFSMISFRSVDSKIDAFPDLKYKYTESNSTRMSCDNTRAESVRKERFLDANLIRDDLKFDFSVRTADNTAMRGYATPLSLGDTLYGDQWDVFTPKPASGFTLEEVSHINQGVYNISYKINYAIYNSTLEEDSVTDISAEGIYIAGTERLCMVGCRVSGFSGFSRMEKAEDSMDCEILINIQLSPFNVTRHLAGTIRSTRNMSDPLYFDTLQVSSCTISNTEARESIERMNMEIAMVLISLTLSCTFIIFQLLYAKKHQHVLPSISITMLAIQTLGHMIPLVLNFEALLTTNRSKKNVLLWSGGWLEANEIIVRVMTMIAFLLQSRLLQLVCTARSSEKSRDSLLSAEKKVLRFCVALYSAGALIAMWAGHVPVWEDMIAYGGLILDGFLLPQIILNIMWSLKDKALAPLFYIGTTAVRALPHLYDVYRDHYYVRCLDFSYIYASPYGGFYSTAWDIIIPLGGLLFALVICFQQHFGGSFFLPQRFR